MNHSTISEASASGEDIEKLISAMEPVLLGAPRAHVIIAALSLAITLMQPDISVDELQSAVRGASQYICLAVADKGFIDGDSDELTKEQIN